MITGVIKNKIDKIWTDIWAGGITNPLTVIEQLTYLMFIRSLDEKELENEKFANMTGDTADLLFPQSEIGQAMRWSKFKDRDSCEIFDLILKIINHIENNGYIEDVKILMKPPFDKPYSFIKMFDAKTRSALIQTIEMIKNNALQVVA